MTSVFSWSRPHFMCTGKLLMRRPSEGGYCMAESTSQAMPHSGLGIRAERETESERAERESRETTDYEPFARAREGGVGTFSMTSGFSWRRPHFMCTSKLLISRPSEGRYLVQGLGFMILGF